MKITLICAAIVSVVLVGCATERGGDSMKLRADAKVTKEQATATALAKVPGGTVKDAELEREHGKLIWSFDIAVAGTKDITEVQVDAKTGAVASVEKEGPATQAKEAVKDTKKK